MNGYCKETCPHKGDAFCEMPRRGELIARTAWLAVAMTAEAAASVGGVIIGASMSPPGTYGVISAAQESMDAMKTRVDACVAFHRTLDVDPLA
jgi:hypothetical protein